MFKKLLVVASAVLFLASAGNVMAWGWNWGDNGCSGWECASPIGDVTLNLNAQDVDIDTDFSTTGHRGNHNDEAFAKATGYVGFDVDFFANGTEKRWTGERGPDTYEGEHCHGNSCTGWFRQKENGQIKYKTHYSGNGYEYLGEHKVEGEKIYEYKSNPAGVFGIGMAEGDAHAWSYAKDYGKTSKAGAGAKTGGSALLTGFAYGKGGCPESITGTLWVGGDVYQRNEAGETGYPDGQFVNGGNESWAGGLASKDVNGFSFFGIKEILLDGTYVREGVETSGHTKVTIDPYGSYRSFHGTTYNSANVDFGRHLNLQNSYVGGQGGVAGMVTNGNGSYASGQATFNYTGSTQGSGNAEISGSVTPGGVFVSGSAQAQGN